MYQVGKETKHIQGNQKVSVHLIITIQSSGAQRLFDHPVQFVHKLVAKSIYFRQDNVVQTFKQ